jgi:D-alanyl-D-alanine carboxypeptidase
MTEESASLLPDEHAAQLHDALVAGVAMGFPGISAALGRKSGLLWAGAAGYDDIANKVLVDLNTRFGIGSITKTFVAAVVFQLVHEGKLELDHAVTHYVKTPVVQHVPNADKATLRQLLNHTSGIPTWEFQPEWMRRGRGSEIMPGHIWGKTETLDYVASGKVKADFAPGMSYAYSNTNYTLLGLAVEAVTGNELTVEIRRRILEPLGMKNTFMESFEPIPGGIAHHYHYATPAFVRDAGLHQYFSEVRPYVVETTFANLSPEWAAGGLVSTPSDLVCFAQALRDGSLLSPAMQKEMFTYVPSENGEGVEYMQGIARRPNAHDSMSLVGHAGGTLGFSSVMYWFEGIDLIVSAMINVGSMHSGLNPAPFFLYLGNILLPAAVEYQKTAR